MIWILVLSLLQTPTLSDQTFDDRITFSPCGISCGPMSRNAPEMDATNYPLPGLFVSGAQSCINQFKSRLPVESENFTITDYEIRPRINTNSIIFIFLPLRTADVYWELNTPFGNDDTGAPYFQCYLSNIEFDNNYRVTNYSTIITMTDEGPLE